MVTVKSSRLPTHNLAYALLIKKFFFFCKQQTDVEICESWGKGVGIHVTWKGKGLTQCTFTTRLCLPAWAFGHRTAWARFIVHPEAEQTW